MDNTNIIKPRVAIAAGNSREEAVRRALKLVREDITAKVKGSVLIKPNFLSSTDPLASTQAEAVRPVLELLSGIQTGPVIIGEGAAHSTQTAFDNFGYNNIAQEFGVELIDLNHDTFSRNIEILTQTRGVNSVQYSDIAANADTRISVAVAKTHDFAAVTLSLKNMMGCLRRIQRPRMHGVKLSGITEFFGETFWNILDRYPRGMHMVSWIVFGTVFLNRYIQRKRHDGAMPGYLSQVRALAENLVRLGGTLMPDISVIDAFEAMEGNGPGGGTKAKMGLAVAGTDAIACDAVMAKLMGFDPLKIGYLSIFNERGIGVADIDAIEIVGEDISKCTKILKPHKNYPIQMKWKEAWKDLHPESL
ncbi:DUF362 domain-containing protein [Candidatus Latescibacterota bacterium]